MEVGHPFSPQIITSQSLERRKRNALQIVVVTCPFWSYIPSFHQYFPCQQLLSFQTQPVTPALLQPFFCQFLHLLSLLSCFPFFHWTQFVPLPVFLNFEPCLLLTCLSSPNGLEPCLGICSCSVPSWLKYNLATTQSTLS